MNAISEITHEWRERIGQAQKDDDAKQIAETSIEYLRLQLATCNDEIARAHSSIARGILVEERSQIIAEIKARKAQIKGEA